MCEDIEDIGEDIGEDIEDIGEDIEFKNIVCFIHVRLLVDIQFRSATVHSSVTQPEPASLGSVLPRSALARGGRESARAKGGGWERVVKDGEAAVG